MGIVSAEGSKWSRPVDGLNGLKIEEIRATGTPQININQIPLLTDDNQQLQGSVNAVYGRFSRVIPDPFNAIMKPFEKRDQAVMLQVQPHLVAHVHVIPFTYSVTLPLLAFGDFRQSRG